MKKDKKAFAKIVCKIPLISAISIMPAIMAISCSVKTDDEIKYHDKESWKHAIEYISSCQHPTIYLTTNAAYSIQQMANLYLASSQLAIKNNRTFADNSKYAYQDQIYCVPGETWNYKEAKPGSSSGYFALQYDKLVDSSFGYFDIISQSRGHSKSIQLDKGNHMLISNMQDFDLTLEKYNTESQDYIPFAPHDLQDGAYKIIDKIMDLYERVDPNIKFNFVMSDLHWRNFYSDTKNDKTVSKTILRMLSKMDQFYIVSDGSSTWLHENLWYCNYRRWNGYMNSTQQHRLWEKITNNTSFEEAYKVYKTLDLYVFYNNEKFFKHFQSSETSSFAPCYLDHIKSLTKENTIKYSSPWLIPSSYKKILGNDNAYLNYLKSYLGLFKYDYNAKKKFSSLFVGGTTDHFSSSRKNLLWMLPQQLAASLNDSHVFNECKKILAKIEKNYPITDWNYIFKAHPAMSTDSVINSLKILFGSDTLPNNVCIIDTVYPFEYTITLDQWMVNEGIETCYHTIDPNTLTDDKPSGIMTSFDMLTTSIYAAMSMLAKENGYEQPKLKRLVQKDCFFIPRKISLNYEYQQGHDYGWENKDALTKFYKPLYQNDEFPNINDFEFFDDN